MNYEQEIRSILVESILLSVPIEAIDVNTELQLVGMDSLSFVRVVVDIENHFDIEFPDERLIISQANTIQTLCDIVGNSKQIRMQL